MSEWKIQDAQHFSKCVLCSEQIRPRKHRIATSAHGTAHERCYVEATDKDPLGDYWTGEARLREEASRRTLAAKLAEIESSPTTTSAPRGRNQQNSASRAWARAWADPSRPGDPDGDDRGNG